MQGCDSGPSGMGRLVTPSVLQQASAILILVEVQITVRVYPDRVPPIPRSRACRAQPARQHLPIESQEGDQAVQFGHIHDPGMIDIDVTGAGQVLPLGQKVALRGKDLDAIVLPVGHKHTAIGVYPDPMRHVELAWGTFPRGSPRLL